MNRFGNEEYRLLEWSIANLIPTRFVHITNRQGDPFEPMKNYLSREYRIKSAKEFIDSAHADAISEDSQMTASDVLLYLLHEDAKLDPDFNPEAWQMNYANIFKEESITPVIFASKYRDFVAEYEKYSLEREKVKLQNMDKYMQELDTITTSEDYQELSYTVPQVKSVIYSYNPSIRDEYREKRKFIPNEPNAELGDLFFADIVLSENVPIIQYNKGKKENFKVFSNEVNVRKILEKKQKTNIRDAIQMFIWIPDPNIEERISNPLVVSLHSVIYILSRNIIIVDESNPNILEHVRKAIPFLELQNRRETKIRAKYDIITNTIISKHAFYDFIMTFPIANIFLYTEEKIMSSNIKSRIDIHYRSISDGQIFSSGYYTNAASVSFTISNRVMDRDRTLRTNNSKLARVKEGDNLISINITRANSRIVLDEFIKIFHVLMNLFIRNQNKLDVVYSSLIRGYRKLNSLNAELNKLTQGKKKTSLVSRSKPSKKIHTDDYIRKLDELHPELTKSGDISRRVAPNLRPKVIEESEVKEYKAKGYQVMKYPRERPMYFVSTNKSKPYVGLKIDKSDPRILYPCCYAKDNKVKGKVYYKWLHGEEITRTRKTTKPLKTDGVLEYGGQGELPSSLGEVLHVQYPRIKFLRYGVNIGNRSFIDCLCDIFNVPNNKKFIAKVLAKVNLYVCAQEAYGIGKSMIELRAILNDKDAFVDPLLFYRLFEEYFGINIYIFDIPGGDIAIPYHRVYHSHFERKERKCLVLLRNFGAEVDGLLNPNCELMGTKSFDEDEPKFLSRKFSQYFHRILSESYQTFTSLSKNDEKEIHRNLYYYSDFISMIPYPAVAQRIDDNGKAISFDFRYDEEGSHFTIICFPIQPVNLPISRRKPYVIKNSKIIKKFELPSAYSTDKEGKLDGYWYKSMDFDYAFFIPYTGRVIEWTVVGENQESKRVIELPKGPVSPVSRGDNIITKTLSILRNAKIIYEICRYLFEVYYYDVHRRTDIVDVAESFAQKFFDTEKTSDYSLLGLEKFMPFVKAQALSRKKKETQIETNCCERTIRKFNVPSLIEDGKIIIYNQDMYQGLLARLRAHFSEIQGMKILLPNEESNSGEYRINNIIPDFYQNIYDYDLSSDVLVFSDEQELYKWYNNNNNLMVKDEIERELTVNPYIYKQNNKMFIVQGTMNGTLGEALYIAQIWKTERINQGATGASVVKPRSINYRIYTIDELSNIRSYKQNLIRKEDPGYIYEVLLFQSEADESIQARYIALLPLN